MKYFVSLQEGAPPREVDVTQLPSGDLEVKLDGRRVEVDVLAVGKALSIRIDGHMIDLTTEGTPPDMGAIASGHRSYVRVESERQRAAAAASKGDRGASAKLLKSPMPGRIVKVFVAAGATVEQGDPLVVVEAMKMENELRAKGPGLVAEVFVKTGDTVEGNARLLSFS
jgi:hypothetical protein